MEKRVTFKSTWLPWLLIAPQMAVILVFFFWPAAQANGVSRKSFERAFAGVMINWKLPDMSKRRVYMRAWHGFPRIRAPAYRTERSERDLTAGPRTSSTNVGTEKPASPQFALELPLERVDESRIQVCCDDGGHSTGRHELCSFLFAETDDLHREVTRSEGRRRCTLKNVRRLDFFHNRRE